MMKILKKLSLSSRGLRYKLRISFYLMSILPALISLYLVSTYILPTVGIKLNLALLIIVGVIIAISGFIVIRQIVDPIVNISSQAKTIAGGNIDYKIKAKRDDEIGELEEALGQLTSRIKDNMKELERYSEESKEINFAINRKVVALSGLLQISSFISENAGINEIFNLSIEKIAQIGESDIGFLLLREDDDLIVRFASGINTRLIMNQKFNLNESNLLARIAKSTAPLLLKNERSKDKQIEKFKVNFKVKNAVIVPIIIDDKLAAIAGIGNNEDFEYKKDELRLLEIFIKQITIAIENDLLVNRVSSLEVKDALTGLYNNSFMTTRLEEEIKRAITYQRPCSFILFSVDRYKEFCDNFDDTLVETTLKKIALILKESISDIDKAGKFSDSEFAVILPEKNKKQAQIKSEEIIDKIQYIFKGDKDIAKKLNVKASVSENPIDGVCASDLIDKARGVC